MSSSPRPRYPIYIPSKGRHDACYMAQCFLRENVDFKIVVEPSQVPAYEAVFGMGQLLVLPEDGLKLLGSRLWIREHALAAGFDRHWQFDDNIRHFIRLHRGQRIICSPNAAISAVEDFTDRYTNIGLSGFNYTMFTTNQTPVPFVTNCHVYSASLVNNRMPYKWRLLYNDDTDLCLQILTNGLCTLYFNAFTVQKIKTMTVKGGNTDDPYQKDGRLRMARSLEALWPDYVTTELRFGRAQHVVNWKKHFNTPLLRRADLDWGALAGQTNDYGLKLTAVAEIKSPSLREFYEKNK